MGEDIHKNPVYIIGRRNASLQLENMYQGLMDIFENDEDKLIMINCMPYVNWRMVIGGFLSRRLGIIKLGRPLVSLGTRDAYYNLVSLVEKVKMISVKSNSKR